MSSFDWESRYRELSIDLVTLRIRCSQHRQAAEHALAYIKDMGDAYHPALNITHLSEKAVWKRIKDKRLGLK